jgi:recombinational DNA repair protein (RecF pathway)
MPITTTGSMMKGGSLSSKKRCWDCNQTATAFIAHPASGNFLCATCAEEYGLEIPVEPSSDAIGTIEYADGRTEMREIGAEET